MYCVVTATGKTVAKVSCASDSVYNMALAYGDGKIFVPCRSGDSTILRVFAADTLKQLYQSVPVAGGEVQGSIIYHDGAVYLEHMMVITPVSVLKTLTLHKAVKQYSLYGFWKPMVGTTLPQPLLETTVLSLKKVTPSAEQSFMW